MIDNDSKSRSIFLLTHFYLDNYDISNKFMFLHLTRRNINYGMWKGQNTCSHFMKYPLFSSQYTYKRICILNQKQIYYKFVITKNENLHL